MQLVRQQQLLERGDRKQGEAPVDSALAQRHAHRHRVGREEARLHPKHDLHQQGERGDQMRDAVGQAERINLLAAVQHRVGKAGAAEEHADDRPGVHTAPAQRDQLARDGVGAEVPAPRKPDQLFECLDGVAARAEIEGDEVGLAARKHRDRRRITAKMSAIVELGQRGLDGAVATVDRQYARAHAGDRAHSLADLADVLDLIVEDVRMTVAIFPNPRQLGEIAGRLGVGQQGDARSHLGVGAGGARLRCLRRLCRSSWFDSLSEQFRHEITRPLR